MPRTSISNRIPVSDKENLLTYSNDISNAIWSKSNCSWAANQIANPIDGAVTAGALVDNVTNTLHFTRQIFPPSLNTTLTSIATLSVFAKAGSRNYLALGANNGTSITFFDLANGAVLTQNAAGFIKSYGNGWYRCWITYYVNQSTPIIYIGNGDGVGNLSYAGSGNNALYIYAVMINHCRYPSLPVINTATELTTTVRSKIFPINFHNYSNTFSQWNKTNCTITSNAIADPFTGQMTASILVDDSTNGRHGIDNPFVVATSQDGFLTRSVFAKAAPNSSAPMLAMPSLTGGSVTFNLSNGTIAGNTSDVVSSSIRSMGDGWYYCIAVMSNTTNNTATLGFNATTAHGTTNYVGTGNPCIYLARSRAVQGNRPGDLLATDSYPVGIGSSSSSLSFPASTGISVKSVTTGRIPII